MNKIDKEAYVIYQDKLCKLINLDKKELLEVLEKKDIHSKYWQSAFTWTKEQRDEFRDWSVGFFKKERNLKFKKFFFQEQALEAFEDDFDSLINIWVDQAGWRMEGTEVRPAKPDYLYVNAPKWMPVIWTAEEFNSCSFNDLSRFWINSKYAIEEKNELGIRIYSKHFSDAVLKKLEVALENVYTFQNVAMQFIELENNHPRISWIRKNLQKFFLKEFIEDAIREELNIVWKT